VRHTIAIVLVLALPLGAVGADDTDAKAVFGKMEATLLKAKSFQTDLAGTTVVGKRTDADVKGRLLVAAVNKLRVELESKDERATAKTLFVSDGKKTHASVTGRPAKTLDTDKQLTERALASTARAGFAFEVYLLHVLTTDDEKPEAFKADEELAVSDFKLGKKEMVGGVEAQAVDYALKYPLEEKPAAATVWIDTKTNLPVKRVITMKPRDTVITITETYTKSVVDGKIDEKEFELPKK
jgi:outer membrane lipoprotein-sorting protein